MSRPSRPKIGARLNNLHHRVLDDAGFAGGAEALPFGILVFVIGGLLLANAWGVVDAKLAASAAAREATRAYVESNGRNDQEAAQDASLAASMAMAGHGRDAAKMTLQQIGSSLFERCAPVTFEVTYSVPAISLPWVKGLGPDAITVRASHSEVIDPYRSGVPMGNDETETQCP